jgi:L-threonylcarbamoyladenylate synthase
MIQINSIDFQNVDPKILAAASALKEGRIVLIQTQTVWSLICLLDDEKSIERLLSFKRDNFHFNYECLVNSIEQFKQYVPDLSPRVETLLSFHSRPLSILLTSDNLPQTITKLSSKIAFRMDNSVGINTIIQLVNQGLWATPAFIGAEIKGNAFDLINESAKTLADEIVQLKNIKNITGEEAVLVELDEEDNLAFLRE